ncbi:MAG: CPBP family intramembrane metalloprotease [Anaerolineae bacterium]|nr:CPBP family intramembrane metalloprotease [Anaerolineae bacterium]
MRPLARVWKRLPTIVRAVVVGSLVVSMGTVPQSLLTGVNFQLMPAIPWSVPVMALYLWCYWQYLGGRGWPRTAAEWRRRNLRACALSSRVWKWSLLAGGLAWASLLGLRIFFDTFFGLPADTFPDVSTYPFVTIVSYVLMASVVAGIAEEAGFRGYMQGPIERRHGPLVAILVVGIVFWLAHFANYIGYEWLFFAYMWFYLASAIIFGALAYLTDSILPAVVLHAIADVLGFGLLWWWGASPATFLGIGDRPDLLLWTTGSAGVVLVPLAIWAYQRLAMVVRPGAEPAP